MVEVEREPEQLSRFELENCCFCRQKTPYWYTRKDVACCECCARFANASDVPSKKVWMRRERIAAASTIYDATMQTGMRLLPDGEET